MTSNITLSLHSNSKILMDHEKTMVDIVFYTIIVLLGTTGNSLVIWVAGFHMKPTVTNVWLVNLAVADLIFCLTRAISLTKKLFYDHWPFGVFLCKFNGFFKYANMFCSVFLLAVISVDRALCVCHPVFTRERRTLCAARVVSVGVWIVAMMFSSPYFVYRQVFPDKNNLSYCSFKENGAAEAGISAKMSSNITLLLHTHFEVSNTTADIEAIMNKVSIVFLNVIVLLGTTGNSLVIWVAGFLMKPNVTNVWLVNLAVADLIFCLTRVISLISSLFFNHWPFGLFLCKFNGFFKYANMFCSVFLLAVISVDRALCVCHPVFTRERRTLCAARVVSVGVWIVAVIFSSPYFVYREVFLSKSNLSQCSLEHKEAAEADDNSAKMTTNTTLLHGIQSEVSNHHANTTVDTEDIVNNINIVFLIIIIFLGTTGNSLVIWVAGFLMKPSVTNIWLINLAVADLIFCLTRVTSLIRDFFYDHWHFGVFLCKFTGFFKYANMFCSVFLLAVISVDRALCVCHPVFTRERRTLCAARVVSVGVWIVAVIFSSPYFVFREVFPGKNNLSHCSVKVTFMSA
ncbi:hypothetical protein cypCar_00026163 [Cyprinus carpio]|nr:hypothetical protein cypCar_00026163 [Cyprinus carpio]